jgi:hypothetical protein
MEHNPQIMVVHLHLYHLEMVEQEGWAVLANMEDLGVEEESIQAQVAEVVEAIQVVLVHTIPMVAVVVHFHLE